MPDVAQKILSKERLAMSGSCFAHLYKDKFLKEQTSFLFDSTKNSAGNP
jgi:hypothetical protein